jgi:hypothetical protein
MTGPDVDRPERQPPRSPEAARPVSAGDPSTAAPEGKTIAGRDPGTSAHRAETGVAPPSAAARQATQDARPPATPPSVDPYLMVALAVAAPVILAILAALVWLVLRWLMSG